MLRLFDGIVLQWSGFIDMCKPFRKVIGLMYGAGSAPKRVAIVVVAHATVVLRNLHSALSLRGRSSLGCLCVSSRPLLVGLSGWRVPSHDVVGFVLRQPPSLQCPSYGARSFTN